MKSKSLITLILLLIAPVLLHAAVSNAKLNFEKALLLEEANGRLEEAISFYRKVIAETRDEALAAQAQLHVGICYEKLGKQEAKKAYQIVVEKYPAQREAVSLARQRLAKLAGSTAPAKTMTVREFLRSGEFTFGKISNPASDPDEFVTTSDGQIFAYTDWMTGDLVVKNFLTGKTQGLYGVDWFKSTEFFMAPVLSPDEKKVAYVNYSWTNDKDLTKIEVDSIQGGNREVLYAESKIGLYAHDWSPDGNKILASLESADRSISLVTAGVRDKKLQRLVTLDWEYPRRATYSPDAHLIAYDSTKNGRRKIYIISADGLQERVLVESSGEDDSPIWTRDGQFLLFRSNRSGDWDLYALPMKGGQAGGDPILIKSNIGGGSALRSITADGKLFYGEQLAGPDVVIIERDNKSGLANARVLPKVNSRINRGPAFAPDGKHLAYASGGYRAPGRQIVVIASLDGKVLKQVPLGPEFTVARGPAFSPDGKRFAVRSEDRKRQPKILIFSSDTGTLLKVIDFQPDIKQIRSSGWFKDGRLYAAVAGRFAVDAGGAGIFLETIDVDGEKRTSTPLPKGTDYNVSLSPDGKNLLFGVFPEFVSGQDQKRQIVIRSLADGSDRILKTDLIASFIIWDFDSQHVLYKKTIKKGKDEQTLYRYSIENGNEEILLKDCKDCQNPAPSPDGKYLAFQKQRYDARIFVLENFLPKARAQVAAAR